MIKKLVVAMSVLGFVSCPVFAATTDANANANANAKPKHHHKRHHKVVKQPVVEHVAERIDYKNMGTMPPEVCTISQNAMIIDRMTQSAADVTSQGLGLGRSMPNPCSPGWEKRVQISGGINVDFGKFGNRNGNFMGENVQRFSLNDAYFNIAAVINEWTKAFASISYNTATINGFVSDFTLPFALHPHTISAEYSSAYSNNAKGGATNALQLEQAYATFGNFDMSPVFIQLGKQFQDFGRYEIHPIERSMTQVLSETLATSGKIGFIANGFNGSAYVFDDPINKSFHGSTTTNYGAALGYDYPSDQFGFDLGVGYLYNMVGVNDVAYIVDQYTDGTGYHNRASALAAYADANIGPFVIGARYTTALQRFKLLDLPKNGTAFSRTGAKPWAAGGSAAYGFEGWGKNQNVYLGYQASNEAAGLDLPKYRWLIGYGIELFGKNTDVGVEWDYDKAYAVKRGGTNNSYNLVSIRTAVKFG